MKLSPSTRRWLAGLGVAGAFVAASAAPAAAESTAKLYVLLPDTTVAVGSAGVVKGPLLLAEEATTLRDVSIRYDYRALSGKVTVTGDDPGNDCSAPETGVLVCQEPFPVTVDEWFGGFPTRVKIAPTEAAKLDDSGNMKITVLTGDTVRATSTSRIRVGEGVDLAAGPSTDVTVDITKNFGNFSAPVTVSNVGGTTVKSVVALFAQDWAITPADRWSNCYYEEDILLACQFDEEIAPGETRSATFNYSLRPDTYAPGRVFGQTEFITPDDLDDALSIFEKFDGKAAKRGTGAKLALKKAPAARAAQTDVDPTNNFTQLNVNVRGKRGADLAAVGATLRGTKGSTVKADLGFRNNGPATLDFSHSDSEVTLVDVTVPTGTTAVTVPEECVPFKGDKTRYDETAGTPGAAAYRCFPGPFAPAGELLTGRFTFRIDKAVPNAEGSVRINAKCECSAGFKDDLKPANDLAKIVVNPAGTGGQGGGDDPTLPLTGSATGLIAGLGALLLAAGAGGYVVARRRRTRFVA
ncbi:LPXTG cell wall anchor domain-containing protein [Micromonospora auratinigra]|uniref:LPXTG-motif cell wall anchor domain-containing protein n=1 Tax=Micromonospora auratinigra TaxID=261654 RepID=A0A1A9A272_9ACTN|nr:LPXTG cell wall anchor domain-containing protein [Micromonospora auratinigra]SBT50228.1 LPXTG-motif cell wall anchor domain-containing protein [Micromonospora auratinigra]